MIVHVWEGPQTGPAMVAMLRRALSDPEQIELMREFMIGGVFVPVANLLSEVRPHDAGLRTAMIASQAIGLMAARRILKIAPLNSLPTDQLASLLEGAMTHLVNDSVDTASVPADSTREGHQS